LGYIPRVNTKEEESTSILSPRPKVANPGPSLTTIIAPVSPPRSQLDLDAESVFQGGYSTVTGSTKKSQQTFSSFIRTADGESVTSHNTSDHEDEGYSQDEESGDTSDILSALSPFTKPNRLPPQCIHEIPSPSLLFSLDIPAVTPPKLWPFTGDTRFCDCDASLYNTLHIEHDHKRDKSRPPIRYNGFIEPVDEDMELASFENTRRSVSFPRSTSGEKVKLISHFYPRSALTGDATDRNYEGPIHSNTGTSNRACAFIETAF
jgi:hypothetical protein